MSETAHAEYLEGNVFTPEQVDTSLRNTITRAGVLGRKAALIAARSALGLPIEHDRPTENYHPSRYVELNPDTTHVVDTEFGSQHKIDIYGADYLGTDRSDKRPVVMTAELSTPSDKGFKSPIIERLGKLCNSQERSLITISSEGFLGSLSMRQLCELQFDTMAHNAHDCIDKLEEVESVEIPHITTTGGSRGGTMSLLMGSSDILNTRAEKGKPDRSVPSMVPIAPAGLVPMDAKRKLLAAKQFVVDEPMHVIRKASVMKPKETIEYGKSFVDTIMPASAAPAVVKTGAMFLSQNPLKHIGSKLDRDTAVSLLVFEKDYITAPDDWEKELQDLPNTHVTKLLGCHLSIDSTRIVYRFTRDHLLNEYGAENIIPLRSRQEKDQQATTLTVQANTNQY